MSLGARAVMERVNGLQRREVPAEAEHLTAMIDVQANLLYYSVYAWSGRFSGWCIDYGTYPEQDGRKYFTLNDAKHTLKRWMPTASWEDQVYAGLMELTEDLCGRAWSGRAWMAGPTPLQLDLCLIDANWVPVSDAVGSACINSPYSAQLMPSRGMRYGANSRPIRDREMKPGYRLGHYWYTRPRAGDIREVVWDTNIWKSHFMTRMGLPLGDPGSVSLFGHDPEEHQMLAEHVTAERSTETEGRWTRASEWKLREPGLDNQLFNCSVGCAVAASILSDREALA